jgi:hypothetical protein
VAADPAMAKLLLAFVLATFAFFTTFTGAVTPLKVQGSEYVNSVNGDRFQIIGVAYVWPVLNCGAQQQLGSSRFYTFTDLIPQLSTRRLLGL